MLEQRLYYSIYVGIIFLSLGIFVSVSVPSLYHIFMVVPCVYFTWKYLKSGYKLPKSSYALIGLVLTGYLSNIVNYDGLNDVMRSFGKQKYYIFAVLSIFPLKAFFKNYVGTRQLKIIINIFFFTIIAAAIFGTFKYRYDFNLLKMAHEYTKHSRVGGFTGIMRYGYGMGFVLTFMISMLLYRKKLTAIISPKWFYLTLIFGTAGFVLSFTRGAILGVFCSLPFILWFYRKKWGVISLTLVGILISAVVAIMFLGGHGSSRFLVKITQSSNLKRLSQYETSLRAFAEKPVLGHGVNQFSSECVRIKDKYNIWWKDYCNRIGFKCEYPKVPGEPHYCGHSHNIFLEMMANMGIIGLLFFVAWLGLWSFELLQRGDLLAKMYLPFIVNFVVASQFEMTFDANNSFLIFFLYPLSFVRKSDLSPWLKGKMTRYN